MSALEMLVMMAVVILTVVSISAFALASGSKRSNQ